MPREPDVLGQPVRPKSPSVASTTRATSPDLVPVDAGHRIEIDPQLVGMVEILGAHRMRVQLEAREIGEPGERGGVAGHDLLPRSVPRGSGSSTTSTHERARGRRALLEEVLATDAVGIADHHVGPPARAAQGAVGDGQVVAHQVELGMSGGGEEHLPGIGDGDLAAGDRQPLGGAAAGFGGRAGSGHGGRICG